MGLPYSRTTFAFLIFGKWFSMISAELVIAIGTMGHPVFSAILKLPSLKGSSGSSVVLRVPSGKMHMEMPLFMLSMPARIVFSASLTSSLFINRQCRRRIQLESSGKCSRLSFATYPVRRGHRA